MTQSSFGTVAPTSRRAVAYIIDALIAAGIGIALAIILTVFAVMVGPEGMLGVIGIGAPLIWLVLLGWFLFYTFLQAGRGSIGMRAQGLRLARESDGAPIGFGKALLRNIIFGLSAAIVVGYFTPLFDGSGRFQGWHDKVAGSLMLDARAGGHANTAPQTQAVPVPPRPSLPNSAVPIPSAPDAGPAVTGLARPLPSPGSSPSNPVPPVPGLATPVPPQSYAAPDLDATVRAVSEAHTPAPQISAPHLPVPPTPAAPPAPQASPAPQAPPAPQAAEPVPSAAAPATGEETLIAFVPGITQDGPPDRSPAAPPAPATPAQVDDLADIEDTRISIPGHRLVFTWDDGTRVTVSRRTLFGRNPASEDGAVAVPVRDETLSLSKTHFEAAAESSGGWVMDRHSTNGTVIVRDGHRIVCAPDEQVRIRLGDAIEIGDRIVTVGGYA